MVRIGIDTGGTFTDIAVFDGSRLRIHKLLTTSDDPSIAIASGMQNAFSGDEPVTILAHGPTIGTNALLQNRLPPTAFITTRGFRDVVEIGQQKRLGLYDLDLRKPQVPVPRLLRLEVEERVRADGVVETALVESEIAAVVEKLSALLEPSGVQAVAVGFLHSYQSPAHEQAVEERLRERFGERLVVCRSSAVLPEFREYERFSTTILNAALTPILKP